MLTFYTGQIMASRHVEQKKKGSTVVNMFTEVNVMFTGYDIKGETVMQMDAVRLSEEYNDLMKSSIGKYVAIPYRFLQLPTGSYMFPADDIEPLILDKNPTEYKNPSDPVKKVS